MARDLGDPMLILLLWFVGALFALGGAMIYGELGAALPHAGGDYVYLREAYGPLVAFLSGWTSFTIGFGAAVAASAISFSSYALRVILIEDEHGWLAKGLSLSLLWIATLMHCRGVGIGGRMQLLLTTTKVVAIGGLILGGLWAVTGHGDAHFTRPTVQQPTLGASAIALVIVTYCYLGWNVAGYIAGDIIDPRRTLPKIMIGGTAFVAVVYLLLNVVYLSALSITELAREPIVPVAEKAAAALWGPQSGRLVAAILCLSIAGAVSAMTWAGPRVYWAMARDGMISPRYRLPKPLGVTAHCERNLRTAPRLQRPRSLVVYGLDPLHDLSSSSYKRREPPPIPRPTLSLLARGPRPWSFHIGHLQSRPATHRIVVRRGDRPEWNSALLRLAQTPQSSPT
jgi:APA family basic amino acid/polyamine antiporter